MTLTHTVAHAYKVNLRGLTSDCSHMIETFFGLRKKRHYPPFPFTVKQTYHVIQYLIGHRIQISERKGIQKCITLGEYS